MSPKPIPGLRCHHRTVAIKAAPRSDSWLAARCAALASFGAALVHFGVAPAHGREWALSGLFFVSLALLQLSWARVVLVRTTTAVLAAGIALNVGAVALWVVTRTSGAPFGPHAGVPELVQAADLCALLLQIYVVMGASWIWYRGLHGVPISAFSSAAVLIGALGVVTLASTVGVVSGQQHGHHGAEIDHADGHAGHDRDPVVPLNVKPVQAPAAPLPVDAAAIPAQPLDGHGDHDHHE